MGFNIPTPGGGDISEESLAASVVSATPTGNLSGATVAEQLAELDGQFQALAGPTRIATGVAAAVDTTINTTTVTSLGGGGLIASGTSTGRRIKAEAFFSVQVPAGFVAIYAELWMDGAEVAQTLLHPTPVISSAVHYGKPNMVWELNAPTAGAHTWEVRIKQDGVAVSVVVGGAIDAPRLTIDEIVE